MRSAGLIAALVQETFLTPLLSSVCDDFAVDNGADSEIDQLRAEIRIKNSARAKVLTALASFAKAAVDYSTPSPLILEFPVTSKVKPWFVA